MLDATANRFARVLRARGVCGVLVTHDADDAPPGARIVQLTCGDA